MDSLDFLRDIFQHMVEQNSWQQITVAVKIRTLSPEEAIGRPEHHDYPLVKGRERMMEAEFLGSRGQAFTDMYGDFTGTLEEVCTMKLENNFRRAIFISTLNAAARHLGLADKTLHCKDDRPPHCAKELVSFMKQHFGSPRVALVGFQPRMAEALSAELDLRVTDMDPDNVGHTKFGIHIGGPEETFANLAWCDVALVTGTTLANDTMLDLIVGKPTIFFGVTIAAPAHFLNLTRFCPYGT